jgi:hypothetical protein
VPQDRNWALGEKCEACERGGQPCGPNERFERFERHNGRTPAGEEGFSQPLIHQASPPSNAASPELYSASARQFGHHPQTVVTPASQLLDDGWTNTIDEVPGADQHQDLAQLLDEAGLQFDEPGGRLVSSGAEVLPNRYGPQFIPSSTSLGQLEHGFGVTLCYSFDTRLWKAVDFLLSFIFSFATGFKN